MTREFIYTDNTFQIVRMNDIRVKKKNISTKELQKKMVK